MIPSNCGDRVFPAGVTSRGLAEVMLAGGINGQEEPAMQNFGERASQAKGKVSAKPLRRGQAWQGKGRRLRRWKKLREQGSVSNEFIEEGRGQRKEGI